MGGGVETVGGVSIRYETFRSLERTGDSADDGKTGVSGERTAEIKNRSLASNDIVDVSTDVRTTTAGTTDAVGSSV
jgi:hypothetical protein